MCIIFYCFTLSHKIPEMLKNCWWHRAHLHIHTLEFDKNHGRRSRRSCRKPFSVKDLKCFDFNLWELQITLLSRLKHCGAGNFYMRYHYFLYVFQLCFSKLYYYILFLKLRYFMRARRKSPIPNCFSPLPFLIFCMCNSEREVWFSNKILWFILLFLIYLFICFYVLYKICKKRLF